MAQLPQPFFPLMRRHLVALALFAAWHGAPPLVSEKIGLIKMLSKKLLSALPCTSIRV